MTAVISMESIVKRNEEKLLSSTLGEEVLMMDIESGDYLGLNSVGTAIWAAIEDFAPVNKVCEQLQQEFEIDPESCKSQTLSFLNELHQDKLLVIEG